MATPKPTVKPPTVSLRERAQAGFQDLDDAVLALRRASAAYHTFRGAYALLAGDVKAIDGGPGPPILEFHATSNGRDHLDLTLDTKLLPTEDAGAVYGAGVRLYATAMQTALDAVAAAIAGLRPVVNEAVYELKPVAQKDPNSMGMTKPVDVFDALDPKDGFHVPLVITPAFASLIAKAYAAGEPCNPSADADPNSAVMPVDRRADPSGKDLGDLTRLHLVLDAVARYFTTGGTWSELLVSLDRLRRLIPGGIGFDGYHLLDSYPCVEPDGCVFYQHIFVKDDPAAVDNAVLWEEPRYNESGGLVGGFIERKPLDQLREEQALDALAEGAEVRPAADDGPADPLQLLD